MTTDRAAIGAELEGARRTFRHLVESASPEDLARSSDGTRWTNAQLLFHMMFGYLVVRSLLPLVRVMSRLPHPIGRWFAALLNAVAGPFDRINYWGSVLGSRVYSGQRMTKKFDAVIDRLERRLSMEREEDLARTMPFPMRWDPFFKSVMTLEDVYRYPTEHFDFHREQLTLG